MESSPKKRLTTELCLLIVALASVGSHSCKKVITDAENVPQAQRTSKEVRSTASHLLSFELIYRRGNENQGFRLVDNDLPQGEATKQVRAVFAVVDEEASGSLFRALLNPAYANANILVVDRGSSSGKRIFGKPSDFYGQEMAVKRIVNDEGVGERYRPLISSLESSSGEYKVYSVQEVANASQTVVIYRAPLGDDPQNVMRVTRSLLSGLSEYAKVVVGEPAVVYVDMFATQGAVDKDGVAGTRAQVAGSFFVGVEEVKGEVDGKISYRSVIEYSGLGGKGGDTFQDRRIYQGDQAFATKRDALDDLRSFWTKLATARSSETLKTQDPYREIFSSIDEILEDTSNYKPSILTQTVPFFDDEHFKSQSHTVFRKQVPGVGMEDWEFFKAFKSSKGIKLGDFKRIITNAAVPKSFIEAYGRWHFRAASEGMDPSEYVAAIKWGLAGTPPESIPELARWQLYDSSAEDLARETGVAIKMGTEGKAGLVNPYFAEIATDLLETKAKLGGEIGGEARSLLDKCSPPIDVSCSEMIEKWVKKIGKEPGFLKETGGKMHIWVRSRKWEVNGVKRDVSFLHQLFGTDVILRGSTRSLDDNTLKSFASGFDRMLYKNSLISISKGIDVYERMRAPPIPPRIRVK